MDPVYVVTDVELDGPTPGENSMLAFASVAVDAALREVNAFEAVLAPLAGAAPDPPTMAWYRGHPEAFAAATRNPRPAQDVMARYAAWVRTLPGDPVFAAHPLALDGLWMDYYLRAFLGIRLQKGPWRGDRLFHSSGLCLRSFAAGRLGWPLWDCNPERYPPEWLGHHPHSHRAIDDARGYANLLMTLIAAE